jgi:hypothetical protein
MFYKIYSHQKMCYLAKPLTLTKENCNLAERDELIKSFNFRSRSLELCFDF